MFLILLLGWINFSLFALITSPFWITFLNKHFFHAKGEKYSKFIAALRRIHKPLGVVLIGTAFVHGTIALGGISLHTGLLVALAVVVIVALGIAYYRTRKKVLFKWHRGSVLAAACLLLVHLVFPNLLYAIS